MENTEEKNIEKESHRPHHSQMSTLHIILVHMDPTEFIDIFHRSIHTHIFFYKSDAILCTLLSKLSLLIQQVIRSISPCQERFFQCNMIFNGYVVFQLDILLSRSIKGTTQTSALRESTCYGETHPHCALWLCLAPASTRYKVSTPHPVSYHLLNQNTGYRPSFAKF